MPKTVTVALRKESVDRNYIIKITGPPRGGSHSARRAWIEISSSLDDILAGVVALRKESVDRNQYLSGVLDFAPGVALRKESVDRNDAFKPGFTFCLASLSARRAWIEINNVETAAKASLVALRKESVDRNIMVDDPDLALPAVALRKESVDRNHAADIS